MLAQRDAQGSYISPRWGFHILALTYSEFRLSAKSAGKDARAPSSDHPIYSSLLAYEICYDRKGAPVKARPS